MNKKLQRDALLSDLALVEQMLASIPDEDPAGRMAFTSRLEELQQALERLEGEPDTLANVAIFFGGEPVNGSRSIDAEFAAKAVASYQDVISARLATLAVGGVATRGPIPTKKLSRLNITNVVHGSFGFVFEEEGSEGVPLLDSSLKEVVEDISRALGIIATEDDASFGSMMDEIHPRVFSSVRRLFKVLHEHGAVVRVVQGEQDQKFDETAISRAYDRVEKTEIDDQEFQAEGMLLGVLPIKGEFEFELKDSGEVIRGKAGPRLSVDYLERIENDENVIKKLGRASLYRKTVSKPDGRSNVSYVLLDLVIGSEEGGPGQGERT